MAELLVAQSAHPRALRRRMPGRLPAALAAAAVVALLGCNEELTSPGECPDLCPGGQLAVVDTVLDAIPGQDSSFVGYVSPTASEALLVSTGLPGSEDRAILRFQPRLDSITVNGAARSYTVDSVAISFNVRARDTTVSGLRAVFYRLPATIDSTATFADVEPLLVAANLVDTVSIPSDSVGITVRALISGAKLSRLNISAADSGVLALGMRIAAPQPTGLRVGAAAGISATFNTYVTVDIADTNLQHQTIGRNTTFNMSVSQGTPALDNDLLLVGGEPSARALIRFNLPAKLRDSVSIVRATLELVPTGPLNGLPNDPTLLEARALRSDLGAKSPLCVTGGVCGGAIIASATAIELENGSADTVRFEIPRIVRAWQGTNGAPPAVFLLIHPEAATFMRPVFFSTRSGTGAPRLRISYVSLSSSTSP